MDQQERIDIIGMMLTEDLNCEVCNGEKYIILSNFDYVLYYCKDCGSYGLPEMIGGN